MLKEDKKTNLFNRFKNINRKNNTTNNERLLVKEIAKSYKTKKERGDENPIDTTIEQIMNIIKESQNPDETAKKIIIAAIDANEIPNRIPEKLSILISRDDNISDESITRAVEQSNANVPDEMINTILEEGSFGENDRLRLIKNVEDENIIRKRLKKEFNTLYKNCKDKRDDEVVTEIQRLKLFMQDNKILIDIQDSIDEVVAKKMAENYYNDMIKGTNIYRLSKAIPLNKMYERNISSKVEDEYLKIEKQRGKKEKDRFDKETLENQILMEIAKDVGYRYKKTGRFSIITCKRMQEISQELEDDFIRTIETTSGKNELSQDDIQTIKIQIRGTKKIEEEKEYYLIKAINHIENKSEYLDTLINIVSSEEQLKTLNMICKTGLIEELSKIPSNLREQSIEKIAEIVKQRTNDKFEKVNDENKEMKCKENRIIEKDEEIDR